MAKAKPEVKKPEVKIPDHKKTFTVGLYIEKKLITKATGTSKQEAEVNAAHLYLKKKNW